MTNVQSVGASQVQGKKFFNSQNKYTGVKVGAIAAATNLAAATCINGCTGNFKFSKFLKTSARLIPFYLVPAFIVDYLNNAQKQNIEPNAKTGKGKDFTKVNMGEKWGSVLGGVVGILSCLIAANVQLVKNASKFGRIIGSLMIVSLSALGGHWLGKITDKYTNKQAAKEADEQN